MTRYVVQEADRAEIDRIEAYDYFSALDSRYAELWHDDLLAFTSELGEFPGPTSYVVDQSATRYFGRETRRALFYGPTRKRTGTLYRVYFTVSEPEAEDEYGVIYVLRILHGSRRPFGSSEIEDDTE